MAGTRTPTLLRPSRDWSPLTQIGALTLSAGVITDVTRLAGVEGDGATYPASMVGVWPAATNQILNGNCTTNTTNIDANSGTTLARSTSRYKFGSTSLEITCPGLTNSEGANFRSGAGTAAAGEVKSAGIWVYHEASGPLNIYCQIAWRDSGGSALTPSTGTITAVSPFVWTQLTATGTAPASTNRADVKAIKSSISVDSFWVGGIQLEAGSIATPYIETDGGTASRVAGTITMPASVLDETQMWVAVCVTIGSTSGGSNRIFSWGDDANNRIEMILGSATNKPYMLRVAAGTGPGAAAISGTAAVGDTVVCMVGMSATSVYCGWKGQGLSEVADTNIPTISSTQPHIGRQGFSSFGWLAGSVKWCAVGKGPPTNALENLVNNFGGTDPLPHMFPRSAQLTFLARFNGDGTAYRYSA